MNSHLKNTMNKEQFNNFYMEHEEEILMFLKKLVETNSYSYNEKGIKNCLKIFENQAKSFLKCNNLENNCLLLSNDNNENDFVLLMGHMDTVFPENSHFQKFIIENEIIKGPGTYDMKGGLVVALYALKFLHLQNRLDKLPVKFLINSDEEIGSLKSKNNIFNFAKNASYAMVFEGGGLDGEIVTGRKGKFGLKGVAKGKAGHAAFIIDEKKSAILETAYKIIDFEKLNDPKRKLSCNVGTVNGGTGANTVPENCEIAIDIRYHFNKDTEYINKKLKEIELKNYVKGVNFKLSKVSERPCMEEDKNMEFYNNLVNYLSGMGLNVKNEFRNGVSDANFISEAGTQVLDGFGPIGGDDHSDREYILKNSLKDRIFITVATLLMLSEKN